MSDPQFLKKITHFAEFDGEELQVLGETVKSSRYLPGDSVLEEGSANRALHILKSGRIRVSRKVHDREVLYCGYDYDEYRRVYHSHLGTGYAVPGHHYTRIVGQRQRDREAVA